jgi:excisionase family DNA binding protein
MAPGVVSGLLDLVLDELAADPVALERLRALVSAPCDRDSRGSVPAYTVATLAAELGRSERSIRAMIARGELKAAKRGRGYVISAEAVADMARAPKPSRPASIRDDPRPRRRRSGPGPARRALRG